MSRVPPDPPDAEAPVAVPPTPSPTSSGPASGPASDPASGRGRDDDRDAAAFLRRLRAWRLPLPADAGLTACLAIGLLLLTFALTVDFPKSAFGFQSDEATYYSLAHSLARDADFAYRREDLVRVWEEFPTGPEGIFLKRGNTVRVAASGAFPFVTLARAAEPRSDRLYYGKAYIYPLVAAPFVFLFGTNGFLVLHALLLTLSLAAAYAFLRARSPAPAALAYACVFFFATAAPVYFVWLMPELFNLTLCLLGLFLWCYKEVAPPLDPAPLVPHAGRGQRLAHWWSRWLRSPGSTYAAAVLLGVVTFSKPTNVFAIGPLLALALIRRQWRQTVVSGLLFGTVVAGLFVVNLAITGDFSYQGGDRNSFYGGGRGFPFQTPQSTFVSDPARSTNRVPFEVLANRNVLLSVFPRNLIYFTLGRHTGMAPYFFPGVLSLGLFLAARRRVRASFQWLAAGAFVVSSVALLLYMPFTYSGGGGPIGNRYVLGFYPLLLFVTPPLASLRAAVAGIAIGGLFTAQLVLNPFYVSFHPSEHAKRGPYRWLPVELSLLNDLPMNVTPAKVRQPLGGAPPVLAYFLDDNAYAREGEWFWVRGGATAELILRAPIRLREDGSYESLTLRHINVELRSGDVANEVVVRTATNRSRARLEPQSMATLTVKVGAGLPYKPVPGLPTNYVYLVSVRTKAGFTPLFTSASRDNRYLGAMVHITPSYE